MLPLDPPDDDPEGETAQIEAEERRADEQGKEADLAGENEEDEAYERAAHRSAMWDFDDNGGKDWR